MYCHYDICPEARGAIERLKTQRFKARRCEKHTYQHDNICTTPLSSQYADGGLRYVVATHLRTTVAQRWRTCFYPMTLVPNEVTCLYGWGHTRSTDCELRLRRHPSMCHLTTLDGMPPTGYAFQVTRGGQRVANHSYTTNYL